MIKPTQWNFFLVLVKLNLQSELGLIIDLVIKCQLCVVHRQSGFRSAMKSVLFCFFIFPLLPNCSLVVHQFHHSSGRLHFFVSYSIFKRVYFYKTDCGKGRCVCVSARMRACVCVCEKEKRGVNGLAPHQRPPQVSALTKPFVSCLQYFSLLPVL